MTSECVICGERTDSTTTGSIGAAHGVICDDCAFWCDGNLDES